MRSSEGRVTACSAEWETRCHLAAAHRLAVRDGLNEGTWNHLSAMSPEAPDQMIISPGYTHWSQVTASNLALVDSSGKLIAGERPPIRAGWVIHYPVHQSRPDAKCVMHVHSPYITALAMKDGAMLDTQGSQQAAAFHGDVAIMEVYDGLLDDENEGFRMAEALGEKRILLLRNHGALIVGASVARAYLDLYQLERACMYQLLATGDGRTLAQIPEKIAAGICDMNKKGHSDPHFDAMCRLFEATEPDFAD